MEIRKKTNEIFKINKDQEKLKKKSSHNIFNNCESSNLPFSFYGSEKNNKYTELIGLISHNQQQSFSITKNNKKDKSEINFIKLKVILNYCYQKDYYEFFLSTRITLNKITNKYQFTINDIIDSILTYCNKKSIFLDSNYNISYRINDNYYNSFNSSNIIIPNSNSEIDINSTYFLIGTFPLNKENEYYLDVPADGIVFLKFRQRISKIQSLRYDIFEEENEAELEEINDQNKVTTEGRSKRAKEKRIGYIVKKVFAWKQYRLLTKNKMSLIEAASKVGLSKKTLDEYYNQIKEGNKFNFDFNKHKADKVNILRGYVKKMNEINKKIRTEEKNPYFFLKKKTNRKGKSK